MKDLCYSAQSARDDPPDPPEPEPARSLPCKSCTGGLLVFFLRQDRPAQPLNGGTHANDFCIK